MTRIRKPSFVLMASAALWTATTVAFADGDGNPQIAQSLFDSGRTLMEAGRYAEACPKFADSHRLEPAGGTLLNLALCHELEGKTATAWTEFREALSVATRDQRKDRQDLADSHIKALEANLTRLSVVVSESVASQNPEITLDRSHLPQAAWNAEIPVDPGEHRVAMTARGLARWEKVLATTEAGRSYVIEVPLLEQEPAAALGTRRPLAFWLLLGGAGVAIGTSVLTGVFALDESAYVRDNCSAERAFCRVNDAEAAASRARTLAWVSTATLVVGAAAAVVALVLPLEKSPVALTAGVRLQNGAALATFDLAPLRW